MSSLESTAQPRRRARAIVEQLAAGTISLEHADVLMAVAARVDRTEFTDALPDLLGAADGVELKVLLADARNIPGVEAFAWDLFDNLVLLCRRHHTMVHQQGWQLWRDTDGRLRTTAR